MLSGLLAPDTLSVALRDISQRRRQGIIEITMGEERLEVLFIQGRVVDALSSARRPVDELYRRLCNAGFASPGLKFEGGETAYSALFSQIRAEARARQELDEKTFKLALKELILSELYALWMGKEGFFTFHARMVEGERDILPSISVGQLLLDVVAIEPAAEKYKALIGEGTIIQKAQASGQVLSPEEEILIALVGESCALKDLEQRSLLSLYHLHEGMASLIERGVLKVEAAKAADKHGDVDMLMAALEKTFDSVFEPLPEEAELAEKGPAAETSRGREAPAAQGFQAKSPAAAPQAEPQEDESEEEIGAGPRFSIFSWILWFNSALLQASWVPDLMTVLIVAAALLAPFVFWFEGVMKLAELNP